MGIEVYLQSFELEAEAPLVESDVRGAFGPFLDVTDPEAWRLQYDELNSCVVFPSRSPDGGLVALTVSRPCAHSRLWEAMYKLLGMGNCVAYAPDGAPVVANLAAAHHMPRDMKNVLGQPIVAEDGPDLERLAVRPPVA
jgi:hypothetical protein